LRLSIETAVREREIDRKLFEMSHADVIMTTASAATVSAPLASATIRLDTLDGKFAKIALEALQYSDWLTMQVDDLDRDGKGKQSLVLHTLDDATLQPLASFLDACFRESKDVAVEGFFVQARQVLQQRQTYASLTMPVPAWARKWLHHHCYCLEIPATICNDESPPESTRNGSSSSTCSSTSSTRRSKSSAQSDELLVMQLQALLHWSEVATAFGVQRLNDIVIVALCQLCKPAHALDELMKLLA
jgi:hypothetical protein